MEKRDRYRWLLKYVEQERYVYVLNRNFVDEYVEATGASVKVVWWGANICRQLGSDLSNMAKLGYLKRRTTGLGGVWQPGFPKWVWSYSVGPYAYFLNDEVKD